jgi:hypothetical protein
MAPHNSLSSPKFTSHIQLGKIGVGPDGERFISVKINSAESQCREIVRFDDLVNGSRAAFGRLNRLGAHLISPAAQSEFLRRIQDLGPKKPTFKVATRVGPFEDVFILPHKIIGVDDKAAKRAKTCFDDGLVEYLSWGREAGSLRNWQELTKLATGNKLFILSLGLALCGARRLGGPVQP